MDDRPTDRKPCETTWTEVENACDILFFIRARRGSHYRFDPPAPVFFFFLIFITPAIIVHYRRRRPNNAFPNADVLWNVLCSAFPSNRVKHVVEGMAQDRPIARLPRMSTTRDHRPRRFIYLHYNDCWSRPKHISLTMLRILFFTKISTLDVRFL